MNKLEFQEIMEQHGDYLVRLAYVYVKEWATAEDIVQDVFVKFFETSSKYEQRATLKTYLAKMTINRSCDHLRSVKGRFQILKRYWQPETLFKADTEKEMLDKFTQNSVAASVFALPLKYREVIVLYYYDDMTSREIANLLNLPENTVKTRLKRAKAQLKQALSFVNGEVNFNE